MHNCNWKLEFQGKDVVTMDLQKEQKNMATEELK